MIKTPENTPEWHFITSYIGAALWSSTDGDNNPLDDEHDRDDIAPETLAKMESDCLAFYVANKAHIHCEGAPLAPDTEGPSAWREAAMAGHDFWLTRCGHGVGFWDGDWPKHHATVLDAAATAFGNVDLYVGDDGLIYA